MNEYGLESQITQQTKKILNQNIDTTNIIYLRDWLKLSMKTLNTIVDSMIPIFGKDAVNHMVIYEKSQIRTFNVFSNDGIHILKSIEFCSPIQEYIANVIRYVAERVDQAASDGTTTAILMTALVLLDIQEKILIKTGQVHASYNKDLKETAYQLEKFIDHVLKNLEKYKIDLKSLDQDNYNAMIYSLAYTTSKGNTDISEKAAELFSNKNIPMEEFGGYLYLRSKNETDEAFSIQYEDADISVEVSENRSAEYNDKLGTAIDHFDCSLIIVPDVIDEVRDANLLKDIEAHLENTLNPTVILSNGTNASFQASILKKFNKYPVIFCTYINYVPQLKNNPLELRAILYSNFKKGYQATKKLEDCMLTDVHCHIEGGRLRVCRYDTDNKNTVHPAYENKEMFPEYTALVNALKFEINNLKNSHILDLETTSLISGFTRIYKYMICPRQPILKIGGKSNEHLANINVVEDVLGTITHSLTHGVIIDGLLKLMLICLEHEKNDILSLKGRSTIFPALRRLFNLSYIDESYSQILNTHYNYIDEDLRLSDEVNVPISKRASCFIDKSHFCIDGDPSKMLRTLELDSCKKKYIDNGGVVQSFRSFTELFARMKEVLPKLISTVNIIVPGSVNINPKQ